MVINKEKLILYSLLFPASALFMLSGCGKDDTSSGRCAVSTGETVDQELGRVYRYKEIPGESFYYIGDPDTTNRYGGYIPCNALPESLIPISEIGILVTYSGTVKTSVDPEEPVYFGIELSYIRKATEETN